MHVNTNLAPVQSIANDYISGDNYKKTRALWCAYYQPEVTRRYVPTLEADDLPDVYRRVYSAIQNSGRLAYLDIADDIEALDLFATLQTIKKPSLIDIPPRRQEAPAPTIHGAGASEPGDLAASLFTRAALEVELGAGVGSWPDAPPHTCDARQACGTVLTIRARRTLAARIFNPTHRTCEGCLYERALRIARQVLLEITIHGALFWNVLTSYEFKKWADKARQYRRRKGIRVHYRALPQGDGRVFLMATAGTLAGVAVSTDRAELHELLMFYCNTPEGANISASHGFGGDWQGMRGDGRTASEDREEAKARGRRLMEYRDEKRAAGKGAIQRWTDAPLEEVAAAIGAQVKHGRDGFTAQISRGDLLTRLDAAGVKLREKRHKAPVTDLAQISQESKNCAKSVTDDPPQAMALWDVATLDALEGVPAWDIY